MSPPFIEFIDVHKGFGPKQVLKGVNLAIHRGEITAVIGKSGTGKSVLLKHIIGLIHQDKGKLLFEGEALDRLSRGERHAFHREVSYMFQDNALFDFLTVYDNIALPLSEKHTFTKAEIRSRVERQLAVLSLEGIGAQYPSQLSGGMRKRVALARALITNPKVVLFDEPTTGLDPVRKQNVHAMIAQYQEQFGFTAVIVSHDIPDIFDISQHIAMLDNGKIVFQGTRDDIENARSQLVNDFIHGNETQRA